MTPDRFRSPQLPHSLKLLTACVVATFAASSVASATDAAKSNAPAFASERAFRAHGGRALRATRAETPHRRPAILSVANCGDDGGPDTLRGALAASISGDTIDLSALTCSTITLRSGALVTANDDITLIGPGADALTIDAAGLDSVIIHAGEGTLAVSGITLANGNYDSDLRFPLGGCVYSNGSITLTDAAVTTCHLSGLNYAYGGAIYATGNVTMARSRVVDGVVEVDTLPARAGGGLIASAGLNADHSFLAGGVANAAYASRARGGGLYLNGPLHLSYSTVTSNAAVPGTGGAMFVIGDVDIRSSTFSSNSASFGAAMSLFRNFAAPTAAAITDSTISGNFIDDTGSAVESSIALTVSNSTIAFNTAYGEYTTPGAGILAAPGVPTVLQSTIIANNVAAGAPSDFTSTDLFNLSGSNNLIMVATGAQPEGTISDDPLLAPLASNGGATQTHALLDGSPAIDAGNDTAALDFDQRGPGFARVVDIAADIGAFESGNDLLFANGFD